MMDLKGSLDRSLSGMVFHPALEQRVLRSVVSGEGLAARRRHSTLSARSDSSLKRNLSTVVVAETPAARRRLSTSLALTLIAALILMGVAVAAVVTKGFGWFAVQYDDPASQYNLSELERRAETIIAQQTVSTGDGAGEAFRFEVSQGYYDGSRVAVSYRFEAMDQSADTAWRPTKRELSRLESLGKRNDIAFDNDLNRALREEYLKNGACGVHIHGYIFGDGVWLPDGESLNWEEGGEEWAGTVMTGYRSIETLPKKARNQQEIQLVFRVIEADQYYYKDETGVYYASKRRREIDLNPVVLRRGEGSTKTVSATEDFGTYAISAEASVSPVGVRVVIWQRLPDAWIVSDSWTRGEDLRGLDYIKDYRLLAGDTQLEGSVSSEGTGGDAIASEGFSGEKARVPDIFASEKPANLYQYKCAFQGVPEGTRELRLRPVYAISGEHPEEDLVLSIPD